MTRLAIRGLNDGKQPIIDGDSGVMMACNGEIDNHLELREWLLSVDELLSKVLTLRSFQPCTWNWAMPLSSGSRHLAIAIWDPREKKLLLARDRAGERPLFYSINDGIIAFASLIAALVAPGSHAYNISTNAVHGYLQSGFFIAPETPFNDIQKVSPGEVVTINAMGVQRRRYWCWNTVQTSKKIGSLDAFDEVFRA